MTAIGIFASFRVSQGGESRGGRAGAACFGGGARLRWAAAAALLPAILTACGGLTVPQGLEGQAVLADDLSKYAPSEQPYREASAHFARAEYGLAQLYFRDATEKAPKDTAAWIGLAASYDRLRRFDLADRAYAKAIALSGETAQILNNQGYSQLLRGNLAAARAKFAKAGTLEPGNALVQNNMALLGESAKYLKPGAL